MALVADYKMGFVVAQGTTIKVARVRDALQDGVKGPLVTRPAPRDLRFAWGQLVHPNALALGYCCLFGGDYYVFVQSGDVVLE